MQTPSCIVYASMLSKVLNVVLFWLFWRMESSLMTSLSSWQTNMIWRRRRQTHLKIWKRRPSSFIKMIPWYVTIWMAPTFHNKKIFVNKLSINFYCTCFGTLNTHKHTHTHWGKLTATHATRKEFLNRAWEIIWKRTLAVEGNVF